MLYSILHISLFCVQEIDMYLELCHVSAARSLEQILFSQIHLLLYIPKSDVVLVTQLIIIIVILIPLYSVIIQPDSSFIIHTQK